MSDDTEVLKLVLDAREALGDQQYDRALQITFEECMDEDVKLSHSTDTYVRVWHLEFPVEELARLAGSAYGRDTLVENDEDAVCTTGAVDP